MSSNPDDDDERALACLSRGDRRGAIELMMKAHGAAVFGRCAWIIHDRILAEDIRQQVFIEAYRDLASFTGAGSLRGWLLRIADHRSIDAARRRTTGKRLGDDLAAIAAITGAPPGPETAVAHAELARALEECLARLTHEVRLTVLCRFGSDVSYEELSQQLGEQPATLQARVGRALPVLRRCLLRKGVTP